MSTLGGGEPHGVSSCLTQYPPKYLSDSSFRSVEGHLLQDCDGTLPLLLILRLKLLLEVLISLMKIYVTLKNKIL